MFRRTGQRRGRPAATGVPVIRTHSPTPVPYNLNAPSFAPWQNQVPNQSSSDYSHNHMALPQGNGIAGYTVPEGYTDYGITDHSSGDRHPYQRSQTRSSASDSHSQTHVVFDTVSGQFCRRGGDGSRYGRPFYSHEASPSNLSDYHNATYLPNNSPWENPGSSPQDLRAVEGDSPNMSLEAYDPILDIPLERMEYATVDDPESLQRFVARAGPSNDPWNQLFMPESSQEEVFRGLEELYQDAVMNSAIDNPNWSPDDASQVLPHGSSIGVCCPNTNDHYAYEASDAGRRRGGRQRGSHLPTETANNARRVRQLRACLRCMSLKEQCSDRTPCEKCLLIASNNRSRKWKGCYRSFEEFAEFLSPDLLVRRLSREEIDRFLTENGTALTDNCFPLPLNVGFGKDFEIIGMEFIPNTLAASASMAVWTGPEGVASTYAKIGLPVIPSWTNEQKTRRRLHKWLQETVTHRESMDQWLKCCFPGGTATFWIQSLLDAVWSYSMGCLSEDRKDACYHKETLLHAWGATLLATALSHHITVPEDARQTILRHLRYKRFEYDDPAVNSTRLINKGVKHLFSDMYQKLMRNVLAELDKFSRDKISSIRERTWGHMLCVSILLIVVIGYVQISLVDNLMLAEEDGQGQRNETLKALEKLEEGFSNITQVFHSKHARTATESGGSRNRPPLLHESSSIQDKHLRQLVLRIQHIQQQYKKSVSDFRKKKLRTGEDFDKSKFAAVNTQRLLATFLPSVFPDHSKKAK